jgi:hypothetical protein
MAIGMGYCATRISTLGEQLRMKTPWKTFTIAMSGRRCFFLCFAALLLSGGIEIRTPGAPLQLLSARNPLVLFPAGGNGNSVTPFLSADGRFVLFSSSANNLVPGDNSQLGLDVFLRDRWSNSTALVSANFAGFGGGNGNSISGVVSSNGQFVAFQSDASDLLPGDTNGASDIFVRNLQTGATELISIAADGSWGNSSSTDPVITPDGRYVAFISSASNLVVGDLNVIADVFLRDRNSGTTTLVSVGAQSTPTAVGGILVGSPVITPDGRYVAFSSNATNLVAGQTTAFGDVFLRDVVGGATTWVSSNAAALVTAVYPAIHNAPSSHPELSSDGRFVTYKCGGAGGGPGLILQYDATSSNTTVIASNAFGAWSYNDDLYGPEVTADGRFIAYCTVITNGGPRSIVHLWDTQSATDTLISQDMNGNAVTNAMARAPVVSPDGRFVAFLSNGTNIVANTISNGYHVYIRDTVGGTTQLVDVDTNSAGSTDINGGTLSMSSNGQLVAFVSPDGSLVGGDNNRSLDVFVRDVVNGTNELISKRDATIVPSTGNGVTSISQLAVSSGGRWIAFTSQASDLVTNDFNGDSDVFLWDTVGGTNALVSVALDGNTGSGGYSAWPAVSADGRFVAFQSASSNLVVNDNNGASDIFLRDMQSGTTALASLSIDGVHSGNGDSFSPSISQDGRYLAFLSTATNLNGTATGGAIWHDMQTGTNVTLPGSITTALAPSMSADGRYVAYSTATYNVKVWDSVNASNIASIGISSSPPIISMGLSPTGTRLIYNLSTFPTTNATVVVDLVSNTTLFSARTGAQLIGPAQWSADASLVAFTAATNLIVGDNNGTNDVYLFNVTNNTLQLISVNQTGTASGNGPSDSPAMSGDGRFVVYRSFATDAVPGITNAPNVIMYDRQGGSYSLLSLQQPVSSWVSWVAKPAVSTNGTTVAFQSWTPGLIAQDLNRADDAFAFEQQVSLPIPTNPPPVFEVEIAPAPGAATNGNQLLTWPAIEGLNYQIQFTTNLSDPQWSIPTGNVWVAGGQAYFTVTPTQPAGFYRILLLP